MNQLDTELYNWVLQRQATETALLQKNPPPGVLMVDDGSASASPAEAESAEAIASASADRDASAAETEAAATAPAVPFHYG
eukprot:scaffold112976_cov45-Phaeocystis_antarctica.AAC.2